MTVKDSRWDLKYGFFDLDYSIEHEFRRGYARLLENRIRTITQMGQYKQAELSSSGDLVFN
jgi:hypothetical protein